MMAGGQPIAPIVGTPPPGAMAPIPSAPRDFGSGGRPNQHRLSAQQQQSMLHTSSSTSRRQHKSRSKWHFGIRSRCPVWEVMLEIYRSLQNVGVVSATFSFIFRFLFPMFSSYLNNKATTTSIGRPDSLSIFISFSNGVVLTYIIFVVAIDTNL